MAQNSFPDAVAFVLAQEGGFVDHPADPGGATKFGITRATLASARGRPTSSDDIRRLGVDEARDIYRRFYWDRIRGDDLPAGFDLALFDFAVHSGPARAAKALQSLLGVTVDGAVGPESLAAASRLPAAVTIRRLTTARVSMLESLPASRVFGRGWRRRVLAVEAQSLRRATGAAAPTHPPDEERTMTDTKSILRSRTLWANAVGLLALLLSRWGYDTSSLDPAALAEAAAQIVAAASFIASSLFRLVARERLLG